MISDLGGKFAQFNTESGCQIFDEINKNIFTSKCVRLPDNKVLISDIIEHRLLLDDKVLVENVLVDDFTVRDNVVAFCDGDTNTICFYDLEKQTLKQYSELRLHPLYRMELLIGYIIAWSYLLIVLICIVVIFFKNCIVKKEFSVIKKITVVMMLVAIAIGMGYYYTKHLANQKIEEIKISVDSTLKIFFSIY